MSTKTAMPLYRFTANCEGQLHVAQLLGGLKVRHVTPIHKMIAPWFWVMEVRCPDDRTARILALGWARELCLACDRNTSGRVQHASAQILEGA